MRYFTSILLMMLTGGLVLAQTNNPPDQAPDYSTFAQFIAARNIFNPNRYPTHDNHRRRPAATPQGAPFIALVGTMDYQKGVFAFFNGNSTDYKKVLQANERIGDFVVKDITASGVTLTATSTNVAQTNVLYLTIGAQLRQNGTMWELASAEEAATLSTDTNSSTSSSDSTPSSSAGASDASGAPNDILKRLMQKREQEMK